jgi:hypothetical protein
LSPSCRSSPSKQILPPQGVMDHAWRQNFITWTEASRELQQRPLSSKTIPPAAMQPRGKIDAPWSLHPPTSWRVRASTAAAARMSTRVAMNAAFMVACEVLVLVEAIGRVWGAPQTPRRQETQRITRSMLTTVQSPARVPVYYC